MCDVSVGLSVALSHNRTDRTARRAISGDEMTESNDMPHPLLQIITARDANTRFEYIRMFGLCSVERTRQRLEIIRFLAI